MGDPPPHFHWPDERGERVRLMHAAGASASLTAACEFVTVKTVLDWLDRLGLEAGRGTVLDVDTQVRVLHAAGCSYQQIMAVTGYRSTHAIHYVMKRLKLTPNKWNKRARLLRAKVTRRQVLRTCGAVLNGRRSGSGHFTELRRLKWRIDAAAKGWATLFDKIEHLRPKQVEIIEALLEAPGGLDIWQLADRVGIKPGKPYPLNAVRFYLNPLRKAGIVLARNAKGYSGKSGTWLVYTLADDVKRHEAANYNWSPQEKPRKRHHGEEPNECSSRSESASRGTGPCGVNDAETCRDDGHREQSLA